MMGGVSRDGDLQSVLKIVQRIVPAKQSCEGTGGGKGSRSGSQPVDSPRVALSQGNLPGLSCSSKRAVCSFDI